ncbi:hypothetical protein LL912_10095 [Niabella sp. CC-SYL272]|uniref:hypothetical protein n=1 Tax=Niabella agricola TaxID=2891571 RepID=UPI001F254ABD|nr:hypothetical protein [Niabella agricola]MCF3109128.1 hypothetical protein [Niabella agricola]
MKQLSRQPVTGQRAMIAARLLSDTQTVVPRPACNVGLQTVTRQAQLPQQQQQALYSNDRHIPTPLVLIDDYPLRRDSCESLPAATAPALAALIRETAFTRITQITGTTATALYGSRGANGVLLMELKAKEDLQWFKAVWQASIPVP